MKKHRILQVGAGIVLLALAVSASASLAWFFPTTQVGNQGETNTMPIDGSSSSSYFAYGDGVNRPYGIKTPRHLYNLAWLQYLGMIHLNDTQLKFELADDIDMSGWTLPPIGTETYPFIGNFDGKGFTVSNLTVSNDFAQYNVHPTLVNSSNFVQPHILGFFGVVGNYNNLPAASYSSASNQFVDTGLSNVAVKTSVTDSLMGIAAGYVKANMNRIAVESGTIDIASTLTNTTSYTPSGASQPFTHNISDYALVGYTPNQKTIKKVSNTLYSVDVQTKQEFVANTQGATVGWGGSIDMNSVFSRLTTMRSGLTDIDPAEPFSITYKHLDDSTLSNPYDTDITSYQTIRRYTGTSTQGVVNFVRDGDTSWSSRKHYLVGGKYISRDAYTTNDGTNGYQIRDGSNHFLSFNGTSLLNSNSSYTPGWEFETVNGNGYIRTKYNNTYYYLVNDNGSLETTTVLNQATSWTIEFEDTKLSISSSSGGAARNILYDDDDGWGLYLGNQLTNIDKTRYIPSSIRNNNNNNGLASVTSPQVSFGSFNNGDQVSFSYNGSTYYLCVYVSNNSNTYYVTARNTSGNATNYYALCYYYVNGYVYVRTANAYRIAGQNNRYAFLRINSSNNWLMTTHGSTTNDDSRLAFGSSGGLLNTLTTKSSTLSSEKMEFTYQDTTYFPVMANSDGTVHSDNIGYFVAGSTNSTFEQGSTSPRSIIVASYPKDRVLRGYDASTKVFDDAQIYTITSSGPGRLDTSDTEKYAKYASSKKNLERILGPETDIGGFHFYARNSTLGKISKDSIVEARNVLISDGDKETTDLKATYELPVYSLDFNLTEQGRINFFAGMYNGGYSTTGTKTYGTTGNDHMNGFFSFHRVFRDTNEKIVDIKEVKGIYEKAGVLEYTYVYKNGSNYIDNAGNEFSNLSTYVSSNSLTLLFDTDWLGYRDLDGDPGRVYYFEIPADKGEYCLGSYKTSDGLLMDGAYLMYLDIGAGAAKTKRTAIAEHFLEVSIVTSYPLGVALIPCDEVSSNPSSFDSSNSVCLVIKETYKGILTISRDGENNVTVTRDADYKDVARPSYVSEEIVSVVDPGDTSISTDDIVFTKDDVYESKIEKETYRIQYLDYNVSRGALLTTIIEDVRTSTNDGAWTTPTRKVIQFEDDEDPVELISQTQIDNGEILVFQYLGVNGGTNGISWSYSEIMNQSTTLWYYATTTGTGTSAVTTEHLVTMASICGSLDETYIELYRQNDIDTSLSNNPDISEFTVVLNMIVDTSISNETAVYYMFSNYRITPVAVNGAVVYIVEDLKTGAVAYIGSGTTAVAEGDEITINP